MRLPLCTVPLAISVMFLSCTATGSDSFPVAANAPGTEILSAAPTYQPTPVATPTTIPASTPDNEPYPAGAIGYAISWPQCGASYPEGKVDFGIVGITNGSAMTRNPCFADEYGWATRARYSPSIYMNTNYRESVAKQINRSAACRERPDCLAYNYGLAIAKDAYAYASESNALAHVWWLDVQTVSDWSSDLTVNAQTVRGTRDFLRSKGIQVGISSTLYQWTTVAGLAQLRLPVWDASAVSPKQAADFCRDGKDFGGGRTEQIAWVDRFETVLACGSGP